MRSVVKKLIHDEEIKVIERAMKQYCPVQEFNLDCKKEYIYIYTVSNSLGELDFLTPIRAKLEKHKDYETVMRFRLTDQQNRAFQMERFRWYRSQDLLR